MSSIFFFLAALVSVAAFFIHTFLGQRGFVKPMLALEGMTPVQAALIPVSWHSGSVLFAGLALALGYAARNPAALELAVLAVVISAALVLMFAVLGLRGHPAVIRLPGGYLCAAIALLGAAGVLTA